MKKIIFVIVGFLIIGSGVYAYYELKKAPDSPAVLESQQTEPTNFVKTGYITVNNPGQTQGVMHLIYEEPGKPALKKELELDGFSVCSANNGALPCLAMSVTFDIPFGGKRAVVEGTEKGERVLVRKLYALSEGQTDASGSAGNIFIAWTSAVRLIENCQVSKVFQSHSLDVNLETKDGKKFRAVEPLIDEVMKVAESAKSSCGQIAIATE